ncbi:MAG: GHKL domain-containing protein [Breznakibacter sp.]|nr:GHKL domain-containing protein [Breznakibacter sp.]
MYWIGLENQLKSGRICDAERVEVLLESINTGVDRVSTIVKSLNQFSGAKDNNEQNCDIVAIIENCLIMLQSRLNDRIAIIKEYDQDKLILLGNSSDLHQAIIHILHNAVQSIADKGIIRVRVQRKHNHIVLEIRDSGCGIEGKHLAHVTDPFYTTKSPGEGVGLGLSLTYSIIRAHNGRIEFESEPNVGTTVRISLPITTVNNYV